MMFERADPTPSDPHLGSFFGLALPLLERGIPVQPVQLETAAATGSLAQFKVLIMTYEGMKPMNAAANQAIADWVKTGGVLVFVDADHDPYVAVKSWWNEDASHKGRTPRESLFSVLGRDGVIKLGATRFGKGTLIYDATSPAALSYRRDGATQVRELVRQACAAAGLEYVESNDIVLRRGKYVIGVGLDIPEHGAVHELPGPMIDLFDPQLAIVASVALAPGRRVLLYSLDQARDSFPRVLASSCKTLDAAKKGEDGFEFRSRGPDGTEAILRVGLTRKPNQVLLDGQPLSGSSWSWDDRSYTVLLRFPNKAAGRKTEMR
jgi:hypothetical protein